jgi:uncharacterized membrane protein YhaH (DUF805 family)
MLGFIFGFNARMGRLNYALCSVVVSGASQLGMFVFAGFMIQQMMTTAQPPTGAMMAGPLYAVASITVAIQFILRSMRIRDIGWDPVLVVPAWIAIVIADKAIAATFPAWAIGESHLGHGYLGSGTVVGRLIDIALFALLIFMPSAQPGESTPMDDRPIPDLPPRHEPPRYEPPAPPPRSAAPARPEFGRRQAGRI